MKGIKPNKNNEKNTKVAPKKDKQTSKPTKYVPILEKMKNEEEGGECRSEWSSVFTQLSVDIISTFILGPPGGLMKTDYSLRHKRDENTKKMVPVEINIMDPYRGKMEAKRKVPILPDDDNNNDEGNLHLRTLLSLFLVMQKGRGKENPRENLLSRYVPTKKQISCHLKNSKWRLVFRLFRSVTKDMENLRMYLKTPIPIPTPNRSGAEWNDKRKILRLYEDETLSKDEKEELLVKLDFFRAVQSNTTSKNDMIREVFGTLMKQEKRVEKIEEKTPSGKSKTREIILFDPNILIQYIVDHKKLSNTSIASKMMQLVREARDVTQYELVWKEFILPMTSENEEKAGYFVSPNNYVKQFVNEIVFLLTKRHEIKREILSRFLKDISEHHVIKQGICFFVLPRHRGLKEEKLYKFLLETTKDKEIVQWIVSRSYTTTDAPTPFEAPRLLKASAILLGNENLVECLDERYGKEKTNMNLNLNDFGGALRSLKDEMAFYNHEWILRVYTKIRKHASDFENLGKKEGEDFVDDLMDVVKIDSNLDYIRVFSKDVSKTQIVRKDHVKEWCSEGISELVRWALRDDKIKKYFTYVSGITVDELDIENGIEKGLDHSLYEEIGKIFKKRQEDRVKRKNTRKKNKERKVPTENEIKKWKQLKEKRESLKTCIENGEKAKLTLKSLKEMEKKLGETKDKMDAMLAKFSDTMFALERLEGSGENSEKKSSKTEKKSGTKRKILEMYDENSEKGTKKKEKKKKKEDESDEEEEEKTYTKKKRKEDDEDEFIIREYTGANTKKTFRIKKSL